MDAAITTVVSSVAIVATAIFVVIQLRQAARDRYVTITSNLFEIWQSPAFQEDQLFLLHKLPPQAGRKNRVLREEREILAKVGGLWQDPDTDLR